MKEGGEDDDWRALHFFDDHDLLLLEQLGIVKNTEDGNRNVDEAGREGDGAGELWKTK